MDLMEMHKRVTDSGITWSPPIYYRTQADVDYARDILDAGYKNLTGEQKAEFLRGLRGCFNFPDIYRIWQDCMYLGILLNVMIIPAGTWGTNAPAKLSDYIAMCRNVTRLRNAYITHSDTPPPPNVPINSWQKVNTIEKILWDIHSIFFANYRAIQYTGNLYAGEDGIL